MKTEIRTSLSQNKTLLLLSFLCVILGALASILGELMLPFIIGTLSVIYLFDTNSKRAFSITVSVLLLALNISAFFMGLMISAFSPAAIISAYLISLAFSKGQAKSDTAYICTLICAVFSVVAAILVGMVEGGAYTLEAAISYYSAIIDSFRTIFVDTMLEVYADTGFEVDGELLTAIFDQQVNLIISYVIIGGFASVGIGMKLFGFITSRISAEPGHIRTWRFGANKVYAYFYAILAIATAFIRDPGSIFAISVLNLYNIFLIVFAYIGFRYAYGVLRTRMRSVFAFLVLGVIILLFSSVSLSLISFLGVLDSVRSSQTQKQ